MTEAGTETWPSRHGAQRGCACAASEGAHPAKMPQDLGDATGKQLTGSRLGCPREPIGTRAVTGDCPPRRLGIARLDSSSLRT